MIVRTMTLLFLTIAAVLLQVSHAADLSAKTRLYKTLAKDYEKVIDPGNGTVVQAGISIVCAQLDEESHALTTRVFERYTWKDSRITWNPAEYGGLKKVAGPASNAWTPDIRLINSAEESEERDDINAVILSDGTVYWIPPATYETLCSASEDDDDHSFHCKLILGSWSYDGPSLPLQLFAEGVDTKMYLKDCPYVVTHTKAVVKRTKYDCCPEPYDSLVVTFDVEKRHHDDDDDDDHHDEKDDDEEHEDKNCRWPHC